VSLLYKWCTLCNKVTEWKFGVCKSCARRGSKEKKHDTN